MEVAKQRCGFEAGKEDVQERAAAGVEAYSFAAVVAAVAAAVAA